MGKSFHYVAALEPPLLEVEDRVMFIPRGRELVVDKDEARILIICEGRAHLQVDRDAIGPIGPGDILVLTGRCRQVYGTVQPNQSTRLLAFRIVLHRDHLVLDPTTGWPARIVGRDAESDFRAFLHHRFARFRHIVGGVTPFMDELMRGIRTEAENETSGFRHRVSASARLLLGLIGERPVGGAADPPHRAGNRAGHSWVTEQVKEYLLTRAREHLSLDDVARHLRLSAEHLARVFKKETSMTIFEFVRDIRIARAKVLLASSHLSVNEIAREVGFSSSSLFCRNFKRLVGMTPVAFREVGGGRRSFSGSVLKADD